jgi:hypothetical protein
VLLLPHLLLLLPLVRRGWLLQQQLAAAGTGITAGAVDERAVPSSSKIAATEALIS